MGMSDALGPGALVGRYRILRQLARGGMAELFLAHSESVPGVEQVMVLKRVLPELAAQPDVAQMFLDEARVLATLHHPNIVQIHEVAVEDGEPFLVMEYLRGEDL